MNRRTGILVILLTALTSSYATPSDKFIDLRDLDRTPYDVMMEGVFEGTVASKGHTSENLLYFWLKTGDLVMEVQLGPRDFVEKTGLKLKVREMVTVVGAPAIVRDREVLVARELHTMSGVFVLRDQNGEPLWDPNRPIEMDTESISNYGDAVMCEMILP